MWNGAGETQLSKLFDQGPRLRRFSRRRVDGDDALHQRRRVCAIAALKRRLSKLEQRLTPVRVGRRRLLIPRRRLIGLAARRFDLSERVQYFLAGALRLGG